jgi:hypothetical protein
MEIFGLCDCATIAFSEPYSLSSVRFFVWRKSGTAYNITVFVASTIRILSRGYPSNATLIDGLSLLVKEKVAVGDFRLSLWLDIKIDAVSLVVTPCRSWLH